MSLEFRYAGPGEYPRIAAFIDEFWAKNHIYVRSPELFEWTFRRPGFWEGDGYSFALGEDQGELMGILGGVPYTFQSSGKTCRGVWIMNYAIRPDHRKGTAALKLLSMFRNPQNPVVIASGLNPATVAIYKVLRGQVLPETPRHVVVLPGAAERVARLISVANTDWEPQRAMALAKAFELATVFNSDSESGAELPADWDQANWSVLAPSTTGAVRDLDYLTWRYLKHPLFTYRIITIREGARTGLAVWRLETARKETPEGRVDVDRIGRIVEFIPSSRQNARDLFATLVAQLKNEDAIGADFFGYHGGTRSMLAENGCLSIESHPDGRGFPFLLQPIAAGGGTLNAMFADPTLPPCDLSGDCPWYWTKSDSDQDRPN